MTVLLKMYDKVTSTQGFSIGITTASTAFMAYRSFGMWRNTNPITFVISSCAGIAFSLVANFYVAHNTDVKTKEERNSIYSTSSLFVVFAPVGRDSFYDSHFARNMYELFSKYGSNFPNKSFLNGLGLGFSATTLAIQLIEDKTKIKFQSPITFN